MKILLIHSDGVEVTKNKVATSNPQDQVIEDAIIQITNFPEVIRRKNEEIREYNKKIESGQIKGKPRKILELIKERDIYKVDQVLVYPWAHLSKFLSKEANAMDVCPKIAELLKDKGIEAKFSPFGWYKSFKINCIGHEVAEMYRDVKLYIQPEEHIENAVFKVITPQGTELDLKFDDDKNVLPLKEIKDEDFQLFLESELGSKRIDEGIEPAHIKVMKEFELVDFDPNTDAGNLRWYSKGVIMKNLIKSFVEDRIIDYGAILIDTPLMYTTKNKKLTAQTARFPARSYWVESGNDRYILRYASDFLLFDLLSSMNLKLQYFPLRIYEWEQYSFRREMKGELTGLRRLRSFVMPDMHTLCKDVKSSVEEFKSQYFLIKLDDLGIKSFIIFRATQDFYRENKEWIKELIKKEGQPALLELWEERYFYFVLKFERPVLSAQNRSATLSTNQIDVESSLEYMVDNEGKKRQKYNIHFTDIDGETKYPVILHNSPTGGLERILWGLIETAVRDKDKIVPGFRTWLSPIQVRILTISNEQHDYAEKILEILSKESYRVDFDDRNEKLGKKIRQSEIDWIPYTIILGKKEQEDQTISVRKRLIGHPIGPKKETSKNVNNIKLSELIEMLNEDTKGFPKHKLPKPFRKFSTKVSFRK